MQFLAILLHLAAAVTLLLWAVRMVRTGVERAFGARLRHLFSNARAGRIPAAISGMIAAIMLQSSTAVGVLASGFAKSRIISLPVGLALLLGADLGSALVVQILSVDLALLVPLLILPGGIMFLKGQARGTRQVGRILLGIALIIISLRLLSEATLPLRESAVLPVLVSFLQGEVVVAFILGALFTWLVHSSVASILMVAAFAGLGLIPLDVAIPLVFGANLGGGLICFWLTRSADPVARQIPVGNLIFRGGGAVIALLVSNILPLESWLASLVAAQSVITVHIGFNIALLVLGLPLTGLISVFSSRLVADSQPDDPLAALLQRQSALVPVSDNNAGLALANATRELLYMSELIEIMMRPVIDMIEGGKREQIRSLQKLDDEIDRIHSEIKLYLVKFSGKALSSEEAHRFAALTDFAINLERVGDLVSKNLMGCALKLRSNGLSFSEAGLSEITALHNRVTANMQLALNVLVSNDLDSARQLAREKERMRHLERASHDKHLERLQSGEQQSVETSTIHLEVLRSLKEINTLFASIAFSMLTESGELLESRLAGEARKAKLPSGE